MSCQRILKYDFDFKLAENIQFPRIKRHPQGCLFIVAGDDVFILFCQPQGRDLECDVPEGGL